MSLTRGIEVWTEVGGVHIGKVWELVDREDKRYVRCQKLDGSIFEREITEVHKISELYERGQYNGPRKKEETLDSSRRAVADC